METGEKGGVPLQEIQNYIIDNRSFMYREYSKPGAGKILGVSVTKEIEIFWCKYVKFNNCIEQ